MDGQGPRSGRDGRVNVWGPPGDPTGPPPIAEASPDHRGAGAGDGPGQPSGADGPARTRTGDLAAGGVCLAVTAAVGPLLGLLWAASAPRISVPAVLAGNEAAFGAQGGVDIYFLFICLVAGVIAGVAAFWRGRDAGWPVPVGLALGGFAGSLLAGAVGHAVRSGSVRTKVPSGAGALAVQLVDFRVRTHGLYLVMPASALLVLAILLWASTRFARR
jgi:hypothetical protein